MLHSLQYCCGQLRLNLSDTNDDEQYELDCMDDLTYNGIEINNDNDDSDTALGQPEIEDNEFRSGPSSS